jgi:hydroxypyruvate isomerase
MPQPRTFKYSLPYWCLAFTEWNWDMDRICRTATDVGIQSLELVPPELLPMLKKYGLGSALAGNGMPDPPFAKGVNNPRYHDQVIECTRHAIDECVEYAIPNVIAFTGYRWTDADDPASGEISREQAIENSAKALKALAPYAEQNRVVICLEHLNSRDGSHPMKGHPGYHGDDLDLCVEILQRVASPNVKLLFDIYHVQIMHGDVIRRMRQVADLIGHVHTAGNPGRRELDDRQEINYPGVMRELKKIGYSGFVGHEFIPTRDPVQGLSQAIQLCEV